MKRLTPRTPRTLLPLLLLALLPCLAFAGYTDVRTALSPTATWRCDDASGDLTDSVGSNDVPAAGSGQSYSQASLVPGEIGSSTSVASVVNGGWARAAAPSGINASGTFAVEAWITPAAFIDATNGFIYCRLHTGGDFLILAVEGVGTTTGKLKAMWEVSGTNVSAESDSAVLSAGDTYHVVAVYSQTTVTLYVNGARVDATQGTEDPALAVSDRIGIGMSPYNSFDFATGLDEVSLYSQALTSMDVASLYLERDRVADTDAGVYNAAAIEHIWEKMRQRRTDLAFIGDSNARLADNEGHDDGHQKAYHDLVAPPYGIGVMPFDTAGDWGYEQQGVEHVGPVDVSDSPLPAWLEAVTMTGPTNTILRNSHFHLADGSATATIKDQVYFTLANEDIHNPDEHLAYHLTAANFASGAGTDNFNFSLRVDTSLASLTSGYYQTVTGTDELADYSFDIPAGARGESTAVLIAAMPILTGSPASDKINGPFYAAYQQVEYPDRQPGPRFNVFMAAPGNDTYDCAQAMSASSTEAIAEQLRQFVRLQPPRKMLIIQIAHAINDFVDANDNPAYDPADDDFTSGYMSNEPDGVANNTRHIMDRAREAWAYLDANEDDHYMPGDLRFIVGATHPKDDGTGTINGVVMTHVQRIDILYDVLRDRNWPDVAIIKGNELVTTAVMTANGEYATGGSAHLSDTGYDNHAYREVSALIDALGTPLSQVTPESIAAAVWDRLVADLTTANSIGAQVATNLDATMSSRSTFDDTTDTVDVGMVSGDSAAADNLEAMLDGTGGQLELASAVDQPGLYIRSAVNGEPAMTIAHSQSQSDAVYIHATAMGAAAIHIEDDAGVGVVSTAGLSGLGDAAAAGILATPANKLATDTGGAVSMPDIDGVTWTKFMEILLARNVGKTVLVDNGNGTHTYTFYKQDGTTAITSITFNGNGEWTATQIDP